MAVTLIQPNTNGKFYFFDWTHTEGEANESFTVYGKVIIAFVWIDETTAQPVIVKATTSQDTTTGITTITINCTGKVTSGKGFVVSASN